jgi:RNA polymerase sigma factor (sigma-70 family)
MNSHVLEGLESENLKVEATQTELKDFISFYNQTIPQVYAYMCYRTNNSSDAEDLTAETYEKVIKKWRHLRREDWDRKAWMFRVAHNLVVDYYRKRVRRLWLNLDSIEELTAYEDDPEDCAIHSEELHRIRKYLLLVPEQERKVATLRFATDLSYKEIAQVLGLTESNVGTLIYRVIRKLRSYYEQDEE